MKEHCYWPLVSDLNNVLSHKPVAVRFMSDNTLLEMWFDFLSMFQGMNVNQRELSQHVEFEPNTYYAAFSAELEASAYPMWALVSHLRGRESATLSRRVLTFCLTALQDWLDAVNYTHPNVVRIFFFSMHILHILHHIRNVYTFPILFFFFRMTVCKCRFIYHFIDISRCLCVRQSDNKG